ncbi:MULTISPECIES: MauE/DoxX family redox-associated membrane protein [Streptomyces]|uniref:Methylamine utilisation protein MauE domain-containing protein n=1 Tax=Streptomyces lonegramiae TaxID=3075524 RepID=A0ABU2XGA3_9ACTN|nr:MauE/DoxX family redox-associated membrane protein [Streptomyces sp. DSM 41529]MDT0544970.1 hypothetical protein [Streptomyces sp. DSM 41529]
MIAASAGAATLLTAGLLGRTGAAKLRPRRAARPAPPPAALVRLVRGAGRAAFALRLLGALELLLAVALLAPPATVVPGVAAAVLGAGFSGYLAYARRAAPGSPCGCTGNGAAPVTWRAFARAAALAAGGATAAVAATAAEPWWAAVTRRPVASLGLAGVGALALVALSADAGAGLRWRPRPRGIPLVRPADGGAVPVAATVELLERSLAWRTAAPVVRSALLDHWDDGGWRVLQFAGVYGEGAGARPVFVMFALDATASLDTVAEPAVRVGAVDADTGTPVPLPPHPPASPDGRPEADGSPVPGGSPRPGGSPVTGRSLAPGPSPAPGERRHLV